MRTPLDEKPDEPPELLEFPDELEGLPDDDELDEDVEDDEVVSSSSSAGVFPSSSYVMSSLPTIALQPSMAATTSTPQAEPIQRGIMGFIVTSGASGSKPDDRSKE